jgi:hypothetical protein
MSKAPIYREKGVQVVPTLIQKLRDIANQFPDCENKTQLLMAIDEVEEQTTTSVKINKGNMTVGFGLDKTKKAIACDTAISILKQIRALGGW